MSKKITDILESQGIKVNEGKISKADEKKALETIKSVLQAESDNRKLLVFILEECRKLKKKIKEFNSITKPRAMGIVLVDKFRIDHDKDNQNLLTIHYPFYRHEAPRGALFPANSMKAINQEVKDLNNKIYPMAGDCYNAIENFMSKNYSQIEDSDVMDGQIFIVSDSFIGLEFPTVV